MSKIDTPSKTAIDIDVRYVCRNYRFLCDFFQSDGRRGCCQWEERGDCTNQQSIAAAEKAEKEQA